MVKRRKITLIVADQPTPSLDVKSANETPKKYRVMLTEHDGKRYVGEVEGLALNAVLRKGGLRSQLFQDGRARVDGLDGDLRTGDNG